MPRLSPAALLLVAFLLPGLLPAPALAEDAESLVRPDARHTFERDIRPIFKAWCFDCHGASRELKGELDLRLRRFMIRGGASGAALMPGNPGDSYLLERIKSGEMPPGEKKMPAEQVAILERWIADGAPTAREEPQSLGEGVRITAEERAFWSFQPIRRPPVPDFNAADRVRTPIDALLLERLAERELGFAPDADRLTLLRRVCFDLLGLPPTQAQIERFLADNAPGAYERLVDRLLASPHYGERWGRHWLDVAGYADTEGYTNSDAPRPWSYKYRDYVIASLNEGKPFDQFIQEQLAGDEMVPRPQGDLTDEQIEKLTATGFLRMAADGTGSGANDDMARNQTIADTIKVLSTSLLGLSVGCAQCHDHRYDPIPQRDYYELRAILAPALDWRSWRTPQQRLVSLYTEEDRRVAAEVEAEAQRLAAEKNELQTKFIQEALAAELQKYEEPLRGQLRAAYETPADKRTAEQQGLLKSHPSVNITPGTLYQYNQAAADELKKWDQRIAEVRGRKPVEQFLRVLNEVPGQVPETHVFHRGEFQQPTEAVTPAALSISAPPDGRVRIEGDDPALPTTGRRLAYARWLTSGEHPLVARVLVNRVWLHHFGRGLVATPGDFGVLGQKPSHPELLDWLASEFVAQDWSLKRLHRLILTSTVYRQSSTALPEQLERDPDNTLYSRRPVQRLDAEVVRDRILSAAGTLSDRMYGPAVGVEPDAAGQVVVSGDEARRSVYVQVKRTQPLAILRAFDAPVMETNCTLRPSSTVATQALMLMNSDFILRHARRFAERLRREADPVAPAQGDKPAGELAEAAAGQPPLLNQIELAWHVAYCRAPEESERQAALAFLAAQLEQIRSDKIAAPDNDSLLLAMTNLCQVLLSSNEFLYVD